MNPNDKTADIYDQYTAPLKNPEVNASEVALIMSLVPAGNVLDLGGGTGRHAIPLAQAGYTVTVVDTSQAMLKQLEEKSAAAGLTDKITIVSENALEYNEGDNRFDLIIMMWNAFNEIALTNADATVLLKNCREALKVGGKILINIDNIENFDPSTLKFTTEYESNGLKYIQSLEVLSFDPVTNTTNSHETVIVQDEQGRNMRQENSEIRQRWWRIDQIQPLVEAYAMHLEQKSIPQNGELYLVISK